MYKLILQINETFNLADSYTITRKENDRYACLDLLLDLFWGYSVYSHAS